MITIELENEAELQALLGLIDAGVRASGLQSARNAAVLQARIEAAKKTPHIVKIDEDDEKAAG